MRRFAVCFIIDCLIVLSWLTAGFGPNTNFLVQAENCQVVFLYPECDWSTNQVREVYQNTCTGEYILQNYHYQDGVCGYSSAAPTVVPTAVPTAVPTQPPSAPSPTLKLTPTPTKTASLTTTIFPTSGQSSTTLITPTSASTQPSASSTTSTVTPSISIVNIGKPLSGVEQIIIKASSGSSVDIQAQSTSGKVGAILLGRVTIGDGIQQSELNWNTRNIPNGDYKIYGTVYRGSDPAIMAGPVVVTVYNLVLASSNESAPAANLLVAVAPETISDITFPTEFSPNVISADPNTVVERIENSKTAENTLVLKFSGRSLPDTIITLLIYSNPVVVTVRTDKNGMWTYSLEKPLPPGEHVVYAVAPKEGGGKIRSEVMSFIIAPAFAASRDGESLLLASADKNTPLVKYGLATLSVIAGGIVALLIIFRMKRRHRGEVVAPSA